MCGRGGGGRDREREGGRGREGGREREREGGRERDTVNPLNLDTNGAASVFVSDVSPFQCMQEWQENVSCLERCLVWNRIIDISIHTTYGQLCKV